MIVAAGLTPAWQQVLAFDGFSPGEVNRAAEAHWCASGKVLNVARALEQLGEACVAISPLGGTMADAIDADLAADCPRRRWIRTAARVRVCTTIVDRRGHSVTELVENAPALSAGELQRFREAFRDEARNAAAVVLSGSLSAGAPASFYAELLAGVRCQTIVDARGAELWAALAQRPLLVKPNRAELAATVGHAIDDDAAMRRAIGRLVDGGAQWVLVTSGGGPATLASRDQWHVIEPPACRVLNAIGCGDCLAAGIAAGVARGWPLLQAARLGFSAAAENAEQLLPARFQRNAVERRMAS